MRGDYIFPRTVRNKTYTTWAKSFDSQVLFHTTTKSWNCVNFNAGILLILRAGATLFMWSTLCDGNALSCIDWEGLLWELNSSVCARVTYSFWSCLPGIACRPFPKSQICHLPAHTFRNRLLQLALSGAIMLLKLLKWIYPYFISWIS